MDFNINIVFYLVAYLVGAIPFGLLLAKKFANVDIKSMGSNSIGATNVLRVVKESDPKLAKKLGIATLVLDAFKGIFVLIIAFYLDVTIATMWAISFLAVLGHCYSPYLNFEGGKGVATGVGVLLFMLPVETIIALAIWGIAIKITKISSLSSLLGLTSILISANFLHPLGLGINTLVPIYMIAFIIIYKHLPNLMRLIQVQEKRI
jgi:glycerol-3-phosphate acyltransferase PlsY